MSPGAEICATPELRWQKLSTELQAANVRLLAVSKYAPDSAVEALIKAGQVHFGESRAQALRDRASHWPQCKWHMIGPMQKNKAKYIGRQAAVWHSCDHLEIASAVSQHVTGRELPVLIQVNIADNPKQRGLPPEKTAAFAEALSAIDHLKISGLMGMAPRDGDVRGAFRRLRHLRDELFGGSLAELCMGMSSDYRIAIEEGATIVRIGSTLFDDKQSNNS